MMEKTQWVQDLITSTVKEAAGMDMGEVVKGGLKVMFGETGGEGSGTVLQYLLINIPNSI